MLSNTQPDLLNLKIYFELLYGEVDVIQFNDNPLKGG